MPILSSQSEWPSNQTIDENEVARFEKLALRWWEPDGPMSALLKLNPARIAYIRDQIATARGPATLKNRPLDGLKLLDIGCGGGILSEPMARLGAKVTGIDPARLNIQVATLHAREMALDIEYRCQSLEEAAKSGEQYDIVVAMEVLEHVADKSTFIRLATSCVTSGGSLFLATLNRTLKSFSLAIVGAEYILNWLPRGTHDWHKFSRPSVLVKALIDNGLEPTDLTGAQYSFLADRWSLGKDLSVNYMVHAHKPTKEIMG